MSGWEWYVSKEGGVARWCCRVGMAGPTGENVKGVREAIENGR